MRAAAEPDDAYLLGQHSRSGLKVAINQTKRSATAAGSAVSDNENYRKTDSSRLDNAVAAYRWLLAQGAEPHRAIDPLVSVELAARVVDLFLAGADPRNPYASPL
jgi:hypothetical protein